MVNLVQVKADIPRPLKRRVFAQFALQEIYFNHWLKDQMERWLAEIEGQQATTADDMDITTRHARCTHAKATVD